jgi:hypothetical protein
VSATDTARLAHPAPPGLDALVRATVAGLPDREPLCRECGEADHAPTCSWAVHEADVRRTWGWLGWLEADRQRWARAHAAGGGVR